MPYIVSGQQNSSFQTYTKSNFKYNYPYDLKLKPGSDLHDKIVSRIIELANESRNEISKRFDSWRETDRILTTYMPLDDYEKALLKEDYKKPVSIIFPYSYSNLESLLTYLSIAFFQDPIFQYEGVEDEDTIGAILLEMIIRLHCIKSKVPLALHTVFRDSLSYGIGIALPQWVRRYGRRPIKSTISTFEGISTEIEYIYDLIYEGNSLTTIDPYLFLPDPSVSSDRIQDSEFVGWVERDNYLNLLSEESYGDLFNVKYLRLKKSKRSSLSLDESERETKFGGPSQYNITSREDNIVDVINMYVNLIPKEWELGPSEYPEKWFFKIAADDLLIYCEKADHYHGLYPIALASPEYDGYTMTPIGRLEVIQGLQGILDFLFNSHITNVRKAINDMFIVDPYLININDLKDPEPGKLIRLRRPAWGHGVKDAVAQLNVNDITRLNISDSSYITQWMDRISGADQTLSGVLRQSGPERLTRSEFQGTRTSAISRLQRLAMIISYQLMQDIGTMFAVHTQQYMSKETYVKITGSYAEKLLSIFPTQRVRVTPQDIAINYDVIVKDGSIPGGNFSDAWIQLFNIISSSQELIQMFDVPKIFTYIARELGAKNVEDFKRNIQQTQVLTMPDEEVLKQAQAGNIVPIGEANA